jgi:hypothetical protein
MVGFVRSTTLDGKMYGVCIRSVDANSIFRLTETHVEDRETSLAKQHTAMKRKSATFSQY